LPSERELAHPKSLTNKNKQVRTKRETTATLRRLTVCSGVHFYWILLGAQQFTQFLFVFL
jgi:hypothetical protein